MLEFTEGKAVISVPKFDKITSRNAVFYNPLMYFNRDISVLFVDGLSDDYTILCGMAGTGIRPLRYFLESRKRVFANDINPRAADIIKKNAKKNNVILEYFNEDFNVLKGKYDIIDIDPFGSPARYMSAGMRMLRKEGYIFATATDTAALCGSSQKSCLRKYGAHPLKTHYCHETGLRILIGTIVSDAARWGYGATPQLCFYKDHYMRVHVKMVKGKRRAVTSMKQLGFINHCWSCLDRSFSTKPVSVCKCGNNYAHAYPVWGGPINDNDVIERMLSGIENSSIDNKEQIENFLLTLKSEVDIPFHWDAHEISSYLKIPAPKMEKILEVLDKEGHESSKTHFSPTAFKTRATIQQLSRLFRDETLFR